MALSPRERLIVTVTGLAAAVFVADRYVVTPYFNARQEVGKQRDVAVQKLDDADRLFRTQRRLEREERQWKQASDPAEAERQLLAVRNWAQEAGLTNVSTTPHREPRADRTQVVRLDAAANGNLAAVAKLLWRVETSAVPLKVDQLEMRARADGVDDLAVTFQVSTIWVSPEAGGAAGARPTGAPGIDGSTPRRAPRREDL